MCEDGSGTPKARGRPRKGYVYYRSRGRVKCFDPATGSAANLSNRLPADAVILDGLGFDWCAWKSAETRCGYYNAARRTPFRKGPSDEPARYRELEDLFRSYNDSRAADNWMVAVACLFDGVEISSPVILEGVFWVRFLARVFIREAGADGINRSNFERPEGKAWASVNVLPKGGAGYNYTEEAWYAVANMVNPPAFCVRVEGSEAGGIAGWAPEELAECVLWSLWSCAGVDSCAADSPRPETGPQEAALAPEAEPPCPEKGEAETPERGLSEPSPAIPDAGGKGPEPAAAPDARTWGDYKASEVWLKGLTTSKDLQAPMPLAKVLEMVTAHEVTKRRTDGCRPLAQAYLDTGDKKPLNEYKRDNLHVWYAAAAFADRAGGAGKSNVSGYTGLACLDFDGFGSFEKAEDTRDDLFVRFKEVLFSAVSASGLGVYCLVALDFDGTEDGYKSALWSAMRMFEAEGYMPDTGCADPTRARYLSHDAEARQRPDGWVPVRVAASETAEGEPPPSLLRSAWTNSGRRRKGIGKEYRREALQRIAEAADGTKDDTMTSVLGTMARLIRNYALNAGETYDLVRKWGRDNGYDERKTEDKIRRFGVDNERRG